MGQTTSFDITSLVEQYVNAFPPSTQVDGVFLFGSYARGDVREDSDVDLIILSKDFAQTPFMDRMILLSRLRRKAPKTLEVPMDIFGYTPEEFEELDKESVIMRQAKKEGRFIWRRGQ